MKKTEMTRKKEKLKELHDIENELNNQIGILDKKIRKCMFDINLHNNLKKKLSKRISHNMRLRNKIISELVNEK